MTDPHGGKTSAAASAAPQQSMQLLSASPLLASAQQEGGPGGMTSSVRAATTVASSPSMSFPSLLSSASSLLTSSGSSSGLGFGSSTLLAGRVGRGKSKFQSIDDGLSLGGSSLSADSSGLAFDDGVVSADFNNSIPSVPGGPSDFSASTDTLAGVPGNSSANPEGSAGRPPAPKHKPIHPIRETQADLLAFQWVNGNRALAGVVAFPNSQRNRALARILFTRQDFLTKLERDAAGPMTWTTLPPAGLAGPGLAGPVIVPSPPGSIPRKGATAAAATKRKAEQIQAELEANKKQHLAAAAAAAAAVEEDEENALLFDSGLVNEDPEEGEDTSAGLPSEEEEDGDVEEGGEGKAEPADLTAWNKLPISAELKTLIPPGWWKPAKASAIESKKSALIRQKEELTYASVPLIATDKARRAIVAAHSMPPKAIAWPKTYMPDEELKSVKDDKHLHSKQLYKLLKTELPAVINRDADVFGVVLTLVNALGGASPDDVKHVLLSAVLPLLIDNNMRTSDVLQRLSLELYGIKPTPAPTGKSETVNATSYDLPLLRQHLDARAAEEKVTKSLAKVIQPTSRPPQRPSSSSSSKRGGRGGNAPRAQFSGPTTSSSRNSNWSRPAGRGGNFNRGSSSSRGSSRGGGRGNSRGGGGGRGGSSTPKSDF